MKIDDRLSRLERDLNFGREYGLLDSEEGRAAVLAASYGITGPLVRSLIEGPIKRYARDLARWGPFAFPSTTKGDVAIGVDLRGRLLRFPSQYLNGHSLTLGGSGAGKTTKSKRLFRQVAPAVQAVWGFDFAKQELGALAPELEAHDIKLLTVPARELRLNPLQCPKDVSPQEWAPWTADTLSLTAGAAPIAGAQILPTILTLYRDFGVLDGSRHYPTLFDLREALYADPSSHPQARKAIVGALDRLLLTTGDIWRWRVGWESSDLAQRHIVFELGGVSEIAKTLILNSLLLPEFVSRVTRGVSNPVMDLWICCDEAARLVSSRARAGGIADLIGLVRGTGIGLDLSVQSGDIAPSVLSNTACKFLGRCGSATDYNLLGSAMGLTREQQHWLKLNLRPGMFVGQFGEGEWRRPFVFRVPPGDVRVDP